MNISDTLGDMLTRIRNGHQARKTSVRCHSSAHLKSVLDVIAANGYIRGYTEHEVRKGINEVNIELKYFEDQPVIKKVERVSTPGRRVYLHVKEIKPYYNGLGRTILSTSQGIMTDVDAKERGIGGEALCRLF
jgi:small subunit ribosomal protein S8